VRAAGFSLVRVRGGGGVLPRRARADDLGWAV